jgi:hypothetical protein
MRAQSHDATPGPGLIARIHQLTALQPTNASRLPWSSTMRGVVASICVRPPPNQIQPRCSYMSIVRSSERWP